MLHTFQHHWLEASPITGERMPFINNIAQKIVCFVYIMVVVRSGLWPLPSPRLNPCCFYLWAMLKDKEYSSNHLTDHDLKNSIRVQRFHFHQQIFQVSLTFSRLMTYIYIYIYMSYRTANLQMLHFIYLFNKYTY